LLSSTLIEEQTPWLVDACTRSVPDQGIHRS
jgi:hypothetical protein